VQGRGFTPQDNADSQPVLIVNQTMARQLWPGEDAIGKQLRFGEPEILWQVIGVVADIKHNGLSAEEGPVIYQSHAQKQFAWLRWMTIVARTKEGPLSLAATVRQQIQAVDKTQPVYDVATMEQLLSESVAEPRFSALLLGFFGLLAMSLAAVGIYGVISYSVSQRTREIGIRMALGAQASDVRKMVVGQGMTPALIGVVIGLVAAFALTPLMSSLLYGVTAKDPVTFAAVAFVLSMVALVASYIPARRATRVDPMVALRYE
jgi:putative ABC transport system permease protein